ncbi:GEVED domain-containing protein [Flavobacterium sp. ZE23DGlu08]|uniref:GEVED domain-containing protein n=1 Tax=Flavobacterium sp. ZE23DGlu08 TaxID=3059026 RepID=UPI0026600974|nr:GEVED domain-containing protein [Flavobacterium sp. ZE23DGlu08]WKL44906.1 GEVED domain-containing protein [Flavobacterium sp. ZE23DGlu08]
MSQNYFSRNTDSLKFTTNSHPLSFLTNTKEKQHKTKTLFTFLSLFLVLFLEGNLSAQTTLFSSGFETTDTAFTSSITTGTITQPFTGNAYTGTKSGQITSPSGDTYSGSIITPTINFVNGRWYTITVWANVIQWQGILRIVKSTSNTNTSMTSATGGDQLLWPISNNVTSGTYNQYSVTFQATATETKYIGFYMSTTSSGNNKFGKMNIDDISIIENTTLPITYCAPSVSSGLETTKYISKISFIGTLNDVTNQSTFSSITPGYQDFTNLSNKAIQAQGEGINVFFQSPNSQNIVAWVDWNKDGDFYDTGEKVYSCDASGSTIYTASTTFGFVIPQTTASGDYRIRIRCVAYNSTLTVTPCGNINTNGETEDYLFTVIPSCSATITSITNGFNCGTGSVTLGATATTGSTQYRWYDAQTGGTLVETTASTTWSTPTIAATTTYYVTAFNGSCESLFRTPVVATIKPVPALTFANANPEVCGENSIISLQATGSSEQVYLIDENFESGSLGSFSNNNIISNSASINNSSAWQIKSSTFVPGYPPFYVWFPAISSGFGTNKFAMAASDVGGSPIHNELRSTTINASNFLNLTLSLRIYFSRYTPDNTSTASEYVGLEISDDNGASWAAINPNYTTDLGIGTRFDTKTYVLNSYAGKSNLRVRIIYYANGWFDGVAIDDIKLFGDRPLSPSFEWTSALPIDAYTNAACTLPYTTGTPASIVYVKPTLAQLEQSTYSFTAKANLANGCSTSAIINVTNKSKVWQNLTTDWNNANNWKPVGIPTADNCVIIPSTSIIPIIPNPGALAKNLTVKSTGNLELSIGSNLTVTDFVKVETNGIFNIKNKASLIQKNETNTNTGTINVEKTTSPFEKYDYTYWSTPVTSTTISTTFPTWRTDYAFEFKPSNFLDEYDSETGAKTPDGFDDDENDWLYAATMTSGKGYIIMGPTTGTFPKSESVVFNGVVNNGVVNTKIFNTPGTPTDDDWNLVGNPYPSAISADAFINANSNSIDATLYFWTHKQDISISNPGPDLLNFSSDDYAMYNLSGGIGTSGSFIGTTEQLNKPSGNIASCQSFFVESKVDNVDLIFNNTMRLGTTNTQFYKTLPINIKDEERDRLWLNMENSDGIFSQQLIGYFTNTTNDYDNGYDGLLNDGGNYVNFYSFINEDSYKIQGRETFNNNDQVRLGYFSAVAGSFNINIDSKEGVFKDSKTNIYLEDKELNIIHDLKKAPYVFNTEIGEFKDRFSLRYTDKTLGVKDVIYENSIQVVFTRSNNVLNITNGSNENTVVNVSLFNIQGKLMSKWDVSEKEQTSIKIPIQNKTSGVYIVKLKTTKGNINKKIIIK